MCPKDRSHKVIKWGKTKERKQRWRCLNCQRCFVYEKLNSDKIFKQWMSGIVTKQIANIYGVNEKTIRRRINDHLSSSPAIKVIPNQSAHLLIDGTYFKRENCLIIYFDVHQNHHQAFRYTKNEREEEIAKDLRELKRNGVNIISVTADGKKAIKKAVMNVFPKAIFQRCLVHIQRYTEIYLTQNPKTEAGRELLYIIRLLNNIDNHLAKRTFLARLNEWQRKYYNFLKEKTYHEEAKRWWHTHRNIRRVVYHINQAMPDMFKYLDHPNISKDTNRLEGRFTDLKHKLRDHRGLKKTKRENYFNWYLHYKNREERERNTNRFVH